MSQALKLASFSANEWGASGGGLELKSAIDGSIVAVMPPAADVSVMVDTARKVGGPALRKMTYIERGKMLRGLAEAIMARKEELYDASFHTGATRTDSWIDIEGGAGTFFAYSSKAKSLGSSYTLLEGDREAITKGNFYGQHILTPLHGLAVHINAYNFPVWGMLEKLAPALLAGVPAIVKPATATCWLTYLCFRIMQESNLLPTGAVQLLLGPTSSLLDQMTGDDVVAFTGSASTASKLKTHPTIIRECTRFASEQDSLNACVVGTDVSPGTPEFDLFVKEVVREMTVKAGQKCTAIRRVMVPNSSLEAAQDAIVQRLSKVVVGDPRLETTRMGALAGVDQRQEVLRSIDKLKTVTTAVTSETSSVSSLPGAYLPPVLLRCENPVASSIVHECEAFGPVSTLMPYNTVDDAVTLLRAGKGSLVMSLVTMDRDLVASIVRGAASSHGRLLVLDRDCAADSTGHGNAMPQLIHGGPGRAGGGEELGGLIGMKHYMQRTAIQGSDATLSSLTSI